jgi:hypothetical protein
MTAVEPKYEVLPAAAMDGLFGTSCLTTGGTRGRPWGRSPPFTS